MRTLLFGAVLAYSAACTTKNPAFCEDSEQCTDVDAPFCDLDGDFGRANTCIPTPDGPDAASPPADATPDIDAGAPCSPAGSFLRCDGDTKVECSAEGTEIQEVCAFGCVAGPERCNECVPDSTSCTDAALIQCDADGLIDTQSSCPLQCHSVEARCNDLDPSNDLASYLDLTTDEDEVVLTDGSRFDTDTGTVTNGDSSTVLIPSFFVAAPADGRDIRVFVVRSLTLGSTTFEGTPAAAIVSHDDVVVTGAIGFGSLRPGAFTVGPCVGANSDTGMVGSATHTSGGGGGGSREAGADGGTIDLAIAGGAGGAAFPNPDLIPLRGGCYGGGPSGGRGGGALQIVSSTRIRIGTGAVINAGGGGGRSEVAGGGSGGGILLEAPTITLESAAVLAANGGGGSCPQQPGQDGRASAVAAAGGTCSASEYTDGGNGGTGTMSPQPGGTMTASSTTDFTAGAGGGAAG